jgi:hypothetical protein
MDHSLILRMRTKISFREGIGRFVMTGRVVSSVPALDHAFKRISLGDGGYDGPRFRKRHSQWH